MSVFDQYVKKNESTFERFEMAQIKIKKSGNWQMIGKIKILFNELSFDLNI